MSKPASLREYTAGQFQDPALECDAIMKGGITSGIVYPYAILEIATRYRFRSLGGTSAGAIAAAFAAAAEFARTVRKDEGGFTRLKNYCDELPAILLSLFQPDPQFKGAVRLGKWVSRWSKARWIGTGLGLLVLFAVTGGVLGFLLRPAAGPTWPVIALGAVLVVVAAFAALLLFLVLLPVLRAKARLLSDGFGACGGLTVDEKLGKGLTDWLYEALQDIAFGSAKHPEVLTFGHLQNRSDGEPPIFLRMVTTNLSMGRPHTLPTLGIPAGYRPDQWDKLFPAPVMNYMNGISGTWYDIEGVRHVPVNNDLPVICAVRMSLSFPILFKAIPILTFDHEFASVVNALGGNAEPRLSTLWFSDGGLSSNFPIHLFDTPLPSRPTFAISLDSLQVPPSAVTSRVMLPETPAEGSSVQVTEIHSLADFGWRVLAAAKDWQDQLASEMSGQRERIARVFLDDSEGGLNLDMAADVSTSLMGYGLDAGRLFTTKFNFDEHRWRRLLGVYHNTGEWIDAAAGTWTAGYNKWFDAYRNQVLTYKGVTLADRKLIAGQFDQLARANGDRTRLKRADQKLPGNTGQLRVTARY